MIALAAETFGGWGTEAVATLRMLARGTNTRLLGEGGRPLSHAMLVGRGWALLSVALQRGNAYMVRDRVFGAIDKASAERRRCSPGTEDYLLSVT